MYRALPLYRFWDKEKFRAFPLCESAWSLFFSLADKYILLLWREKLQKKTASLVLSTGFHTRTLNSMCDLLSAQYSILNVPISSTIIIIFFLILYLHKNCPRANTCILNIKIDGKSCCAQSHLHNDFHYWSASHLDGLLGTLHVPK